MVIIMYCNFFGLSEKPFETTPDPKYLFLNRTYKELLHSLVYGVNARRGFIVIIGEVGTGKTVILNALKDELDNKTKIAFIFNTDISSKQMLILTLAELGLTLPKNIATAEALQCLNNFAIEQSAAGGNVLLIVDEAQNLSTPVLENLRLLSNIETRHTKLIQILLSGQPKLDYKLNRPEFEQLAQRISIKRYINHLSEKDTFDYIEHRLRIAKYKGPPIFSRQSQKLILKYSKGIPRKINIICDNALLIAYATENKIIEENIVEEVIRDLTQNPFQIYNTDEDFRYHHIFKDLL